MSDPPSFFLYAAPEETDGVRSFSFCSPLILGAHVINIFLPLHLTKGTSKTASHVEDFSRASVYIYMYYIYIYINVLFYLFI